MATTTTAAEAASANQPIHAGNQVVNNWLALILPVFSSFCAEYLLRVFHYRTDLVRWGPGSFGRMLVVALAVYLVHRFAIASFRFYKPDFRNLILLTALLVSSVVFVWLGCLTAISFSRYLGATARFGFIPQEAFYFAIPYASGALLLQSILGIQYGLVLGVSLSIILSVYLPSSFVFGLFVLSSSLVACLSLSHFRSRSALIKAGFNVSLVAVPFALTYAAGSGRMDASLYLFSVLSALLGGIFCCFLASGVAPIVEYLGGYVTDMRLLEMATLDHPLLKELSVQAPGTWNHSMVMGMMAEAAADSIGANSVLVRVGAYFHDIGKVKKPVYFVENQGGEENRHDKLSTSMSSLIIRTHVKDGVELARKYGLPRAIIDMIPQHHGTSRIEYFYDKARKEAQDAGIDPDSVEEELYRYPGPKPQSREAGILMLADGVEAAARTLSDPDADRILGMVQKMINKVFSSGELNECDLTLRDLHSIARVFTRVLTGIYHQRIAYAEPAEKVRDGETADKQSDGSTSEGQTGTAEEEKKEGPKEDLKRLGL